MSTSILIDKAPDVKLDHKVISEGKTEKHVFEYTASSDSVLRLSWSKPLIGMMYMWHSGAGTCRALKPNWMSPIVSRLSSGMPLTCFFDDAGRNRYLIALDDCINSVERAFGVREEDGTLECKVNVPVFAGTKRFTLYIDETDVRYEDAIRSCITWFENIYAPLSVPLQAKQTMYSCWYSLHQQVFADDVLEQARLAAKLGMKSIIIDDGWQTDDNNRGYAYCGDWKLAAGKIPDMRRLSDEIHALGLKLIIWYSVPFAGGKSEIINRFRDKTLYYIENADAYTLDPRYPEVRQYLIDLYVKAMRDWALDGLKLDFIDSFKFRDGVIPFKEGMDTNELDAAVRRLMIDVSNALKTVKPDVLIEFRQSYIGPAIREFGNMLRVGDCPNDVTQNRVGTVDLRLTSGKTAVHSDMLMWHSDESVERAVQQIENVLFSTVQLSARLERLSDKHNRALKFWTDFMDRHRELLLDSTLYADAPELLYPVVRAEAGDKTVIGRYSGSALVTVADFSDIFIINAADTPHLPVNFKNAETYAAEVLDCMGSPVGTFTQYLSGLCELNVPAFGLIHLMRK